MEVSRAAFETYDRSGRKMTTLSLDVILYFDRSIADLEHQIDNIFQIYYSLAGQTQYWYLTETMRKFKPASKRSLSAYKAWWRDDVNRKNLRELWLQSQDPEQGVGDYNVYVRAAEPGNVIFKENANFLRFVFPHSAESRQIRKFAESCAEALPYASGHGGYVIECNPYHANRAQTAALPMAMRYQAIDIATMSQGPWAVRGDRIKGIYWLNLLGQKLLAKVGGLSALRQGAPDDIEIVPNANGAMIVAGPKPRLGDVNRQEDVSPYVDLFYRLQPAMDGLVESFPPFDRELGVSDYETTERWLLRFGNKEPRGAWKP